MRCIWQMDGDKVKGFKCDFSPIDMLMIVSGLKYIVADIERHPKDRERAQGIYNQIMLCRYYDDADRKTEPTSSKMEQVDKDINVRSKDEPQTCDDCIWNVCNYNKAFKDEPQTQLTAKCLNCNNAKACKEKNWEGCVYEPKDEKTCETCRHWKYIAHEWQCEACKCQGYEPTDEPQTDCAWR